MSVSKPTPSPTRFLCVVLFSIGILATCASSPAWIAAVRPSPQASTPGAGIRILGWHNIADLPQPLAQFDTVFWEPRDTDGLRATIRESPWLRGKQVLEIGTGTGLIALCCLQAGADRVVATDVNAAAVANAQDNAGRLGLLQRLDARLVPLDRPTAFSVIERHERFDLIVSNPPWENSRPRTIADHALFDPGFRLLRSLLSDARQHLHPGGKLWLAYGCTAAIREIQSLAPQYGWQVNWLDDRQLADLPDVFLPGLLLELIPIEKSPSG